MGKTAIWTIFCFSSLHPLNNVVTQLTTLEPSYAMGSQHCGGGEGDF